MSRQNNHVLNDRTNIVVKAVLISLYRIGSIYGPALDNLARQYVELKKEKKATNQKQNKIEYNKKQQEIIIEAQKIISPMEGIMESVLATKRNEQKRNMQCLNTEFTDFLEEGLKKIWEEIGKIDFILCEAASKNEKMELVLYQTPNQTEIVPFQAKEQWILDILKAGEELLNKENEIRIKRFAKKAKKIENTPKKELFSTSFLSLCITIALNIFLNMGGVKNYAKEIGMEISDCLEWVQEDVEKFFENIENLFVTNEAKEELSIEPYKIQVEEILNNQTLSLESKIDKILHLNATDYQNTFDSIIKIPYVSYDYKIDKILHSQITDYRNIYKYLIENEDLPQDTTINAIVNSDIANYQTNFYYLLKYSGLKQYESIEYIVHSNHTYEEKFSFITREESFTKKQKVWYAISIKGVSLKTIFKDLVNQKDLTLEQVIEDMIEADSIPFTTLFDTLLESKLVTTEEITKALISYKATFNEATIEEKTNWCFNTNFPEETKLDTFYQLLKTYNLTEKEQFILEYYGITDYHDFINLYKKKTNKLTLDEKRLLALNEKVNLEKETFVLEYFFDSQTQLDDTIGGVAAEANWTYEDMYCVSSTFFNRVTDPEYSKKGTNPYLQLIAPRQFAVYYHGTYKDYAKPINESYAQKFNMARQAFLDRFYKHYKEEPMKVGIREDLDHDYLEFRSPTEVNFHGEQFSKNGNVYGHHMQKGRIVIDERLIEIRDMLSEKEKKTLEKELVRYKTLEK